MRTATEVRLGRVLLTAPVAGRVRLYPPRTLCGELEVYQARETIATVTNEDRMERVEAPAGGFVRRLYVTDDAVVESDAPLVSFRVTG